MGEALVETSPLQSHEQATGAGARVLLLFEKRDILRRFVAHHVGIGARSMPKIAAASVPPAPTPYDVALIRAHAKLLGSPVVGYVGDLDPHGVHAFAALRSGKIDAPNIRGRHFQVEWLGMTDHWLHLARASRLPMKGRDVRMSWVEREYWQIVKRFAPDVSSLIGDESFAALPQDLWA